MCLILLAVNPDSRYRLVVAANRDEMYARPTRIADFWETNPDLLAGQDEDMGGTWLGVNRQGAFAAVTNFREEPPDPVPPRSRGELPTDFLEINPDPISYLSEVRERAGQYRGFNLLVANGEQCGYFGNRAGEPRILEDGYYGLSNQVLDCNWPKVIDGRKQLESILAGDSPLPALFELLQGEGDDREFSNSFIRSDLYGTRAATVVLIENNGEVTFEERNFGVNGEPLAANQFRFSCSDGS